jgi:hypothetical protein
LSPNGQALPGNVIFDFGAGNVFRSSRPVSIISSAARGTIAGSVNLMGGSGDEMLNISGPGGSHAVSVAGSVFFNGHNGRSGNNNTLALFDGSSVSGNVFANIVSNVQIGQSAGTGAFIGGNLMVNDSGARSDMTVAINQDSEVSGKVSVTGTPQCNALGDWFIVESGATVIGKLVANLGSNTSLWKLGGTFDGSVTGDDGTDSLVNNRLDWSLATGFLLGRSF